MKQITKETKVLYAMIGMMECAKVYADYLRSPGANAIHFSVKDKLRNMFNRFDVFKRDILFGIPAEDRKLWDDDWNNRDYQTLCDISSCWSNMDDKQRDTLVHFAQELEKGEISVEPEYISPKVKMPEPFQNVIVICNDRITRSCTVTLNGDFKVLGGSWLIDKSAVLLWRPDFTEEILKKYGL